MQEPILEVKNLSVSFYNRKGKKDETHIQAVRGISFSLEKGESFGIVGESGSGKSVSSLALMGLIRRPPGEVSAETLHFKEKNILSLKEKDFRKLRGKEIGMIFQEPMTSLDPVFTIGDQIAESIILHQKAGRKEALEYAEHLLSQIHVPRPASILKNYPHQLSGGMRQRVLIATAISCRPEILIADEPTTALDVTVQAQVLQVIKELQESMGTALIMITHDLGVVAETTDRVMVMYGGKVMETGGVKDIFKRSTHPYTEALLKSIPDPTAPAGTGLYSISGESPNPQNPPEGCPFHPRCAYVEKRCRHEFPVGREIASDHFSWCWREL